MTADLAAWLRQQLDEDARIAGETPNASLDWEHDDLVHEIRDVGNGGTVAGVPREGNGEHIARHDPARVLREIDAKRRILEECAWAVRSGGGSAFVAPVLRCLASVYADRPGYAEAVGE